MLRALERTNYPSVLGGLDLHRGKVRLERAPALIKHYDRLLRILGWYHANLKVLKRPDSFWTDWAYHRTGIHDPADAQYQDHLRGQREYIVRTRHARSAGLRIGKGEISTDSLASLVRSYIEKMEMIESQSQFTVVLVAGHWGEYGIFKELGIATIYVVRDPFNSLISHSKDTRHAKDYLRRGLHSINTRDWIDCYLGGPHHYWINHAQSALEQENATIVRYSHFATDWKKVEGLPDITSGFAYRENPVSEILAAESIHYIYEKTHHLCARLGLELERYIPS